MNTAHRNPWASGRHWQVYAINNPAGPLPITVAVCSHTDRRSATVCAWLRDAYAVLTNWGITPTLAYSARRTPSAEHRANEENGVPCGTPGDHYCYRLGLWTHHHTRRTAPCDEIGLHYCYALGENSNHTGN